MKRIRQKHNMAVPGRALQGTGWDTNYFINVLGAVFFALRMNNNIQSNKSAVTPANNEQQGKGITPIRVCPFCGDDDIQAYAYSVPSGHIDGPLFVWNVEITCCCCAKITSCLTVEEAVNAWNGSSAPYMSEGWDVDEMEANFNALPEAGPGQTEYL